MSFRFNWPEFDESFVNLASIELENALNRGKKPSNICDIIRVKELNMGHQPPELDILEIGELSIDRFRGIFKFSYSGDGHLVLETKVQANPLNFSNYTPGGEPVLNPHGPSSPFMPSNPTILAADLPLIVPMQLKISLMRLRAIVVLIVSRTKGITLSFKTDPLESILVSSTFDSLSSVRRHLQSEIENRLRDLFQKELPAMIHSLSIEWLKRNGMASGSEEIQIHSPYASDSLAMYFPVHQIPPKSIISNPLDRSQSKKSSDSPFSLQEYYAKASTPLIKSPSIAAQSAPAELAVENEQFKSIVSPYPVAINQSFVDFMSEAGNDNDRLHPDQHYFRSKRSIIVRAPTEFSIPDPVLSDRSKLFNRKSSSVSKMFKSLFKIPESTTSVEGSGDEIGVGLKAIDTIGMGMSLINSGISSLKSSNQSTTSNCLDGRVMAKAYSTISGNKFSRQIFQDRYSDTCDPDMVQFEPDEFRIDAARIISTSPRSSYDLSLNSRKFSLSDLSEEGNKNLAIKLNIMRRLQSTLSPKTFSERNVLYRSMSFKKN